MNYFLDTNILLIYLRDNKQSREIESELNLLSGDNNLIISVVSVGEIKSIAKQNKWGKYKLERLVKMIDDFLVADINTQDIIEKYAEIDAYSQGKLSNRTSKFSARNMGKNDLWIAATSSIYKVDLITTYNDFNHLNNVYLNVAKIEV